MQAQHHIASSSSAPPLEVVAALIFRGGKVLVAQRLAASPLGGTWEFPGGTIEPGESAEVALQRECAEELGVVAQVAALAWEVTHSTPEGALRLRLYHVHVAEAAVCEPRQAQQLAWLQPAALANLTFCPADVSIVEALCRGQLRPPAPRG